MIIHPLSFFKQLWLCFINYGWDVIRYFRYSQMGKAKLNQKQKLARIMAMTHVIEKGLSLPETRLGYGQNMVKDLLYLLESGVQDNIFCGEIISTAKSVLMAYHEFHSKAEYELAGLGKQIQEICTDGALHKTGVMKFTKEQYMANAASSLSGCIQSRYSLRQFDLAPVPQERIIEAIRIAQKTPSVCNRQSWTVFLVKDFEKVKAVASLQSGNRGFGHTVHNFLVVATSLYSFFGIEERNQSFIDGGLYSMNLLLSLHSLGIGACPLNWSTCVKQDRAMRKLLDIPDFYNIIMIIAVGSIPEEFEVAVSRRKTLNETVVII